MFAKENLRFARYAAGTSMAAHLHESASLNLVLTGGFREAIGGAQRDYAAGHIAFCPAGVPHAQRFGRDGAQQLIVAPEPEWLNYLRDCRLNLAAAPYARPAHAQRLGGRLMAELTDADEFSDLACQGILLEMLAAFGRAREPRAARTAAPAWLRAARSYIEEHACLPLRLAQVAQAAGRHEIHLAREFRRHFGVSMGAYQRRLRVEQAARLLRAPDCGLTAVALECGFASHSHLCRVFRAHLGLSPSQYRAGFAGRRAAG